MHKGPLECPELLKTISIWFHANPTKAPSCIMSGDKPHYIHQITKSHERKTRKTIHKLTELYLLTFLLSCLTKNRTLWPLKMCFNRKCDKWIQILNPFTHFTKLYLNAEIHNLRVIPPGKSLLTWEAYENH